MRMKCTARKEGNEWVLNGTKCWITHGKSSDVVVAIARTGESAGQQGYDHLRDRTRNTRYEGGQEGEQARYARQ